MAQTPTTNNSFGFRVRNIEGDGWIVDLPHQCDSWMITGFNYKPATQEDAIIQLTQFIAEAQEALERLKNSSTDPGRRHATH